MNKAIKIILKGTFMKLIKSRKPRNLMNIYRLYLKSFPKNERKPFPFILLKQWRGTTEVLSLKNSKGEFLGLAITALQNNLALIAYFAISSEKRGKGIGSKALKLLKERYSDKKIDAFFALHMAPEIDLGKIGVRYGKAHATSAMFKLTVNGISSHAALPHKGVDAILIGAKVVEFLQSIVSRRIDPREEAVITVGSFKGGEVENVVCDKVEMRGTIRTMSQETRSFIIETMKRDLPKFVEGLGGSIDVNIREGYAPVINNEEITKILEENVVDLYGKESLEIINEARMDVEDVSYFLNEIKGTFFRLGTKNEEKGLIYGLHHPKFNIDERSLKIGMGIQLKNILEFLK